MRIKGRYINKNSVNHLEHSHGIAEGITIYDSSRYGTAIRNPNWHRGMDWNERYIQDPKVTNGHKRRYNKD